MKVRLATVALLSTVLLPARADLIYHEDFSYTDGLLVTVSTNLWTRHSGGGNDAVVKSGKLQVANNLADDVNRVMTNNSISLSAPPGPVVYAAFTVNLTNLPSASSNYFAQFKDNGLNFRSRLFAIRG